jgi:hypothetical protein
VNWQQTIFYCALTITPVVFLYNALEATGVFKWVNARLNDKPAAPTSAHIPQIYSRLDELERLVDTVDTNVTSALEDVGKLKLALGYKEFKSKGTPG